MTTSSAKVRGAWPLALALFLLSLGCSGPLDAGRNRARGPLPIDERNPILLSNDGPTDNWLGEYALLLSARYGTPLAGLVVNASPAWPDLPANLQGWASLAVAARASGLENVPDAVESRSAPLVRPADGELDSTLPNASEGAKFIVERAASLAKPGRPLVLVTGGRLTDIADAYLLDHTLAERVVVVSSLGSLTASTAEMIAPNGEMDPWADRVVASRLPYVQVSAHYDQLSDLPSARLDELPADAFGTWLTEKRPQILNLQAAADQVAVLASVLPGFALDVQRATLEPEARSSPDSPPSLRYDAAGPLWLVTRIDPELAIQEFWKGLAALSD